MSGKTSRNGKAGYIESRKVNYNRRENPAEWRYDRYAYYARNVAAVNRPVYIPRPFRGISAILCIAALLAMLLTMVLPLLDAEASGVRDREDKYYFGEMIECAVDIFEFNLLKDILAEIPEYRAGSPGNYYSQVILNVTEDGTATAFAYLMPFMAILCVIGFAALTIKYLSRLLRKVSPGCVSGAALIEFLLLTIFGIGAIIITTAENGGVFDKDGFFYVLHASPSTIRLESGWLAAWILSVILFVLPLTVKKTRYMFIKVPVEDFIE